MFNTIRSLGKRLNPGVNPLTMFKGEQLNKLKNMSLDEIGSNVSNYFQGKNLNPGGWSKPIQENAISRKNATIIGGGLITANALDIDPFGVTTMATTLASVGVNLSAGMYVAGMGMQHSKLAGYGYMSLTALNAFRPGDNLGPL